MPHMVAQQHMGIYDALRAGTTRNHTTISAAVSAIGATPTTLVLTYAGDGVWSIGANLTTPSNVTILVPAGVTVNVASGVTWTRQGPFISHNPGWQTGPGTVTQALASAGDISSLLLAGLTVRFLGRGINLENSSAASAKRVSLFTDNGAGNVGIRMSQIDNNAAAGWEIGVVVGAGLTFARPGAAYIVQINDNGLAIGGAITPSTWLLQVAGDGTTNSAAKPTGGSWTNSASDLRVKRAETLRTYTRGMTFVRNLPAIKVYQYNGQAGTPNDGKECVGFIADDLVAVVPEWTFTYPAKLLPSDPDPVDLKGLNDSELIYALTNAVKELDTRLSACESAQSPAARLDGLEGVAHTHTGQGSASGAVAYVPPAA